MPLVPRAISNLFGGVSQQPAGVRLDNQCEEMINAYPSIADGLVKRPPSEFISFAPAPAWVPPEAEPPEVRAALLVAVGQTTEEGDPSGKIMTSLDGITWELQTSTAEAQWVAVAYSPSLSLFVAVGDSQTVITSPDGITWTSHTGAVNAHWTAITWSPTLNLFAAVASGLSYGKIMTSPDGITWTQRTAPVASNWGTVIWAESLGKFVATSGMGAGPRVMESTDGITWVSSHSDVYGTDWYGTAWSEELGKFVAGGSWSGVGFHTSYSSNAVLWILQPYDAYVGDGDWTACAWSPFLGLFAAIALSTAGDKRILTSADGIDWTFRTSPADKRWTSIVWSSDLKLFVAVSNEGTGNRVMTSADGITWALQVSAGDYLWTGITVGLLP